MKPSVISAKEVTKSFSYWEDRPTSLKKILADISRGHFSMGRQRKADILKGVSFDINAGEFVGIMGRNGAGKSTLLKLLSGIYQPTTGSVQIQGQITPLLELGAGFAEDLSGFDNIFLNAAILGYSRARITQSLQDILEFSELGDKIHMPVRNYSSGMLVRLGFSIAVHLDAALLLFDEILAVGDVAFQQKSLQKIMSLHAQGRAVVLVTHSPDQVLQFCSRCIVIEKGHKIYDGDPKKGVAIYQDVCLSPSHP